MSALLEASVTEARRPDPLADRPEALVGDYIEYWAALEPDRLAHTFLDYLASREGVERKYTWIEMDRWSRAVATAIMRRAGHGDRVAILCAQGPEYITAFNATLRAGVIGVPLFAPDMPGHGDRLHAVLADCRPTCVLTTTDKLDLVRALVDGDDDRIIVVDAFDGDAGARDAAAYVRPDGITHDDIAYLQYTSGSTRAPAGVVLTHGNLVANGRQIIDGYGMGYRTATAVSWLPLFHDMGLLIGAPGAMMGGAHSIILDPIAFLMKPQRWVAAMSGEPNVISAAPNFAYGYVAKRTKEAELAALDLSGVTALLNGAEPIIPATVDRFIEVFGPQGLRPEACYPSYGLAEATVFVTRSRPGTTPLTTVFDGAELQVGRAVAGTASGRTARLVSCGTPGPGEHIAIVDPNGHRVADGTIGEIWVWGPNVGREYWERPEETAATFGATLAGAGDLPLAPWLRTADLGVVVDGDLYVTGRIKDLIIVDGRNVYPSDIEISVEHAHPAVAAHRVVAFSVPADTGETVVVVAERHRSIEDAASLLKEIESAARHAVSEEHAVALTDIVIVEPDTVPRTSSGKVARQEARSGYLNGTLTRVAPAG